MIALTEHPDGILIAVRAQAGARKAGVLGEHAGAIKLAVTAPAADGRANAALVALLRELLGLQRSQIELHGGATARNKTVLVRGVSKSTLASRLAEIAGG